MGKKNTNRVYWPNCTVCQYMKKHPDFRKACLQSRYFIPNGRESLLAVNERWGYPVKQPTLYAHMQRHQKKDIERGEIIAKMNGQESAVWQRTAGNRGVEKKELETTVEVIEAPVGAQQDFEIALDEFIKMGRAKAAIGEMNISAANYISAIKVKIEHESKTKDRRLEMLRSMFQGAAPKKVEDGLQNPDGN